MNLCSAEQGNSYVGGLVQLVWVIGKGWLNFLFPIVTWPDNSRVYKDYIDLLRLIEGGGGQSITIYIAINWYTPILSFFGML